MLPVLASLPLAVFMFSLSTLVQAIFVTIGACVFIWAIKTYLTIVPDAVRNIFCFLVVLLAFLTCWYIFGGPTTF